MNFMFPVNFYTFSAALELVLLCLSGRLKRMIRLYPLLRILPILGALVFAYQQGSAAQNGAALSGDWKMVSFSPDGGEIAWRLTIRNQDGKYSAAVASEEGETSLKDFKVEGDDISFHVPYQGDDYAINLKLSGEKLVGTWSGNGDTGDTKGEKVATR